MAQPKSARKRGSWLRFSLRTLLLTVTFVCIGLWGKLQYDDYRKCQLAKKWVQPLVDADDKASASPWIGGMDWLPPAPAGMKPEQQVEILVVAATRLASPTERMAGLKILAETPGAASERTLWRILGTSRDSQIKAATIRLLCLSRKPELLPPLEKYLDDQDPLLRAAAAESLGFLFHPSYEVPLHDGFLNAPQLSTTPPIHIAGFRSNPSDWSTHQEGPAALRERLEAMMLHGPTVEERTAAARALVGWPPAKYSLRVAEWGVWIDDGGELKLVQSVLDEIPPFVHQTANAADSFADRVSQIMVITKPIVHLTSDVPLAVDLEILIRRGRPWYAFPRPDDFCLDAVQQYFTQVSNMESAESALKRFDRPDLKSLAPLAEGYLWARPQHRTVGSVSGGMGALGNAVSDMGLHWQSLIVSPQRFDWMAPPAVPAESRYQWWQSLRAVPSSWIVSQGETERFLYYDGPSDARSPAEICLAENRLYVAAQEMFSSWPGSYSPRDDRDQTVAPARQALVVRVTPETVQGLEFLAGENVKQSLEVELPAEMPLSGAAVQSRFRQLLVEHGLTAAEAEGLTSSWRKQFFETEGTRVLLFLTRDDYDQVCPLSVRPQPTEIVRVGIVLTEL